MVGSNGFVAIGSRRGSSLGYWLEVVAKYRRLVREPAGRR